MAHHWKPRISRLLPGQFTHHPTITTTPYPLPKDQLLLCQLWKDSALSLLILLNIVLFSALFWKRSNIWLNLQQQQKLWSNVLQCLMPIYIFIWTASWVLDWCACAHMYSMKVESAPVPTVQTPPQGSERCGPVFPVHQYPNTVECLVDLYRFISSGWAEYAGSHVFSQRLQDMGQMWLPEIDLLSLLPN